MRKVILNLCTSLDAYIEGKNGEIDWCFTDQDYSMTEFLNSIDSILIGRISYEQLQVMAPDAFQDKHFILCSNTINPVTKVHKVISANLDIEIKKLKKEEGKNIWLFGGASLTSSLIKLNLVDELMISVHPLIMGQGKPLFPDIDQRIPLTLTDTKTFSTGLVQLYYTLDSYNSSP